MLHDHLDEISELAGELEQQWPAMLADLRASGVPLNEAGAGAPGGDGGGGGGGAGDGSAGDGGAGDGGQAAGGDAGAAAATAASGGEPPGEPAAAPAAFDFDAWAATDEGQAKLGQTLDTIQQQRAAEQQAREAAEAAARENPYADVEEGLGLLGIDPARFREYIGAANPQLTEAAAHVQRQQAVELVDGLLNQTAADHPDLLGSLDTLAELTGDDGQPLFNSDEVRDANRTAVLYAASALQAASMGPDGQPGLAHEQAIKAAADQTAKRDDLVGRIAVERYKRELAGVGSAATTVTGNGASGADGGSVEGDEMDVARRFALERGLR